jgi:uncharacterized repeat protein (TIGR01451 family)
MTTRANPFRAFPVLLAFLLNLVLGPLAPVAQTALVSAAPSDGIEDYAQCQIGDGAGLDCAGSPETPNAWTNGILNATHNQYAEDEVVPQRLQMDLTPGPHSVTIRYMTRKGSSDQVHAYDYLATWNHTYVNADRCEELPSGVSCLGGLPTTFDIPSDPNAVTPGAPQPTSAHELPQADRQFVMYGGTITGATTPVHTAVASGADKGSDYASLTVSFTVGVGGQVQLLWGGHLASGFGDRGWGEDLGAGAIDGGPYHMIVDAVDLESIGNRDNQIMSSAIAELLPTLSIEKTPDGGTVTAGDTASFTITVTNNGPGTATNIDVDDTLPAGQGATPLVWSEDPDKAECTVVSNVLHCDVASLAAGASFSVTLSALTDADDCGLLDNIAYADADNNPQVSDPGDITVLCGDIDVDKTPDGGQVTAGDEASFTIVTSNNGDGTATGAELSDVLPAVANGWSIGSEDWAGDCTISGAAGAAQTLECGPEDIEAGGSRSVTVSTETTADDCGLLDNPVASATTTNDGSDEDSGDITVSCPDVVVEKTGSGTVNATDTIFYEITVSNDGDGDAADFEFSDTLPAVANGWTATELPAFCELNGLALTCELATLAAGDSFTIRVETDTDVEDCGQLDNLASASASNESDEDLGNNSDDHSIVVECPGLNIVKTAGPSPIVAGDDANFTVTVWNTGPGTALDVTVHDELPDDVDWGMPMVVGGSGDECSLASSVGGDGIEHWSFDCSLGDIGVSDMAGGVQIEISGETDADDCGVLTNVAFADAANNDEVGPAEAEVTVRCPTLVIDKSADSDEVHFVFDAEGNVLSVDPEQVTWTLTYTLADGPVTNAVISDPLPDFLTFVSASDGGVYDDAARTITWNLGTLTSSGSVTFVTTVDPDAPETDPIVNVATIDSDETAPDDGEDSIIVTSESELGGNPTPTPSVPDTALVSGPAGAPLSVPIELLVIFFTGSLGALAYANVRSVRRRR